ncbi:MAG: hypothetical protein IRY83_12975 [Chloroflexi bacterium]|nr:hypothetical protein [Chloroflexota bacterium]
MALVWIAVGLVILAAAAAGLVERWPAAALVLALHYLGASLLLAATVGPAPCLSAAIVGAAVSVIAADVPVEALARLVNRGARAAPRLARPGLASIRSRAVDLSVSAVAIAGAVELALAHPLLGSRAVDAAVGVLALGGLASCLWSVRGRGIAPRATVGLLSLALAGQVALSEAGRAPSPAETLLLAAFQLLLSLAAAHLRAAGERRDAGGTAAERSAERTPVGALGEEVDG